jgi:DNA-binding CsgD family transcriptional regulator
MTLFERDGEFAAIGTLLSAGGVMLIEGGGGIGKTALVDAACSRGADQGLAVLRARAAELEAGFAFGVVRQLLERKMIGATPEDRELLLAGPAEAAWTLLGTSTPAQPTDASFAVLHGLYWLVANLAAEQPVLIAVDDAHWADRASLQWLGYLAARVEGLAVSLLVALRPADPAADQAALLGLRREASVVLRPRLLSEHAVACIARDALGAGVTAELCSRLKSTSGGNPFYLRELLLAITDSATAGVSADWQEVTSKGAQEVLYYLWARLRRLGPAATGLARALAVLGDGCALRHAAALAGQSPQDALGVVGALVKADVLAEADAPRFVHPIVRQAIEASLDSGERAMLHRAAGWLLYGERAPAGRIAAHLRGLPPAGDSWVCCMLRHAASAALASGAPHDAAELLRRAWAEPPPPEERVAVLLELARAEVTAGIGSARDWLEEALAMTGDPRARARIAIEVARAHATLFSWVDAVDVIERALAELGATDPALTDQLTGELVVACLHDARRAAGVGPALRRLGARPTHPGSGEALAVARGMTALLTGRPVDEVAAPLLDVLSDVSAPVDNWDTRAALLWCLATADGFEAVERAIDPLLNELSRTGSARGLIAAYSSLGFLKLRLGALPEADTAASIAQRVIQEGDFGPGLPFAVTVRADVAVEAGQLDKARALLDLLPRQDWNPGVGTVLIPAAWGRLHLAANRPAEALAAFQTCATMFSADVWGLGIRDVGYLHARSSAAQALLLLGEREQACRLADAELADVRIFGAPRALGVALRAAGLAYGGDDGLHLLADSVAALANSPAMLEQAKSLAELGAAQRRAGLRVAAQEHLAEALDLAARCGATPLAGRVREELTATGARPRRAWRHGAESLTPAELRVARLAAEAKTNRQIAQTLYVTVKTVEGHLAHAYAKLGIAGRAQLAAALRQESPGVSSR